MKKGRGRLKKQKEEGSRTEEKKEQKKEYEHDPEKFIDEGKGNNKMKNTLREEGVRGGKIRTAEKKVEERSRRRREEKYSRKR